MCLYCNGCVANEFVSACRAGIKIYEQKTRKIAEGAARDSQKRPSEQQAAGEKPKSLVFNEALRASRIRNRIK